jgi:Pentapeptide repeats (8 copies)
VKNNIADTLANHKRWLTGNGGEKANLSRADLSEANLSGANLSGANLSWANLSRADLSEANLSGANLSWANLSRADLSEANLSGANLSWANLSRADLSEANLSGANGLVLLPVQDPRGHSYPHAVWHGDQWFIRSGCKCLSIADALAYVQGDQFSGEPWLSDAYVHALGWLTAWAAVRCELGAAA